MKAVNTQTKNRGLAPCAADLAPESKRLLLSTYIYVFAGVVWFRQSTKLHANDTMQMLNTGSKSDTVPPVKTQTGQYLHTTLTILLSQETIRKERPYTCDLVKNYDIHQTITSFKCI